MTPMRIEIDHVAQICHQANQAYCESLGDDSQRDWAFAEEWQRQSAIRGVRFHVSHPEAGPEASHNNWLREKDLAGWKYGKVKDIKDKRHPCMVAFLDLPLEQQFKDHLFVAIVHVFLDAGVLSSE